MIKNVLFCSRNKMMRNLYEEIKIELKSFGKTESDILYVTGICKNDLSKCYDPKGFLEAAKFIEYEPCKKGEFDAEINENLRIILNDGTWFERVVYSDSEWFEYLDAQWFESDEPSEIDSDCPYPVDVKIEEFNAEEVQIKN